MPLFPSLIEAQADGLYVVAMLHVTFAFKSETLRVWEGDGPYTRAGFEWRGMGSRQDGDGNPLQTIDGLEQAINGTAPQINLVLSGVDATVVAAARQDADIDEIEGRDLTIQLGWCDATIPDALIPLDGLITLGVWTMQRPAFSGHGATLRTIALPCETLWTQRSRAPFGLITDRDQQRRFPGDRGASFPPKLVDVDVAWPRH